MPVVLKDNLVKASHHNIVMGMGIKKPKLSVNLPIPMAVKMGNLNLGGGSFVGTTTQVKRKPISFF